MAFVTMILEMLKDWPIGTVLGAIMLLLVLIVLGFVAWGCFIAVDSWFLSKKQGMGKIISKEFTPAHTEYVPMYNAALKTTIPYPMHYEDDWSICVEVAGQQDSISVYQQTFDSLKEGDSVIAEYVSGRFSGGLYLKGISDAL